MKEFDFKNELFPTSTRQAEVSDEGEIGAFLKRAYGDRSIFKYPERWNWEYRQNPYWGKNGLPIYIAFHKNKMIGQTGAMYVPLKIGGIICNAAWSVDSIVLPEYRSKGYGKILQRISSQNHEIFMSLRSSATNRKIKAGLGSLTLINVPTYLKWVKVDPDNLFNAVKTGLRQRRFIGLILMKFYNSLRINTILFLAIKFYIKLKNSFSIKIEFDSDFDIVEVDDFPNEAEEFWKEFKEYFDILVVRDKKYLNWKYVSQPHVSYRKFIAKKSGKICGILVLRLAKPPEANIGIIAEMLALPHEVRVIRQLTKFSLNFFNGDVEAIRCATSVKQFSRVLKEFSFSKEYVDPFVFFSKNDNLMRSAAKANSNFFFSVGDHDYDQYPLQKLKYKFGLFNLDGLRAAKRLFSNKRR